MARQSKRPLNRNVGAALPARINQAIDEGRFQHALELARQLFRQEPTSEHRLLLHRAAMGRARQLSEEGATREALSVLQAQLAIPGVTDEMKARLAEEFALCGDLKQALAVLGGVADPQAMDRLLGRAADAALAQQRAGRPLLPESLQLDFDRVLTAFEQLEAGEDENAKVTLQAIGLRSPFLEWKVFLRGLQAYYQNDDARALENWQRLKPDRLPSRLAAPLRLGIDRDFQTAQPPATQAALQKQAAQLQGTAGARLLRELRQGIGGKQSLAPTFRQAETLLATLRQEAPQLIPRLANVFYWIVVTQGQPEDVPRYQRVFGSPPDDPRFHRLNALGWERSGEVAEAHQHWNALQQEIALRPQVWPGEMADRARALIWQHMGRNAATIPAKEDDDPLLPPFLRNHPSRPKPVKPTAEECFRQVIELAPDQPDGYRDLFRYHVERKKLTRAIAVGREMLRRFPDDVPMLTRLGEALMGAQKYDQALASFQKALSANPLDRELRRHVANAHLFNARTLAEDGKFDAARQAYQTSLEMDPADPSAVLCKWAACEIKAGNPERGEELIQQALAGMGSQLAVSYSMVIEAIRLKLPAAFKKRFDASFKEGLAASPDPAAARLLTQTTSQYFQANVEYTGQKTHQKKVLDYLKKSLTVPFTEQQLEETCEALVHLDAYRLTAKFAEKGRLAFDANPVFPLVLAENEIIRDPNLFQPGRLKRLLEIAREKAERLSPGPRRDRLLDRIANHVTLLDALDPFGRMMDQFYDPYNDFIDDDDW